MWTFSSTLRRWPLHRTDPQCERVPPSHPSHCQDVWSLASLPNLTEGHCGQSLACLSPGPSAGTEKGTEVLLPRWQMSEDMCARCRGPSHPMGLPLRNRVEGRGLGSWALPPVAWHLHRVPSPPAAQRLICGRRGAGTPQGTCGQVGWDRGPVLPFPSQASAGQRWTASPVGNWGSQMPPFWAWKGALLPGGGGCSCLSTWPSFLSSTSVPGWANSGRNLEGPDPENSSWGSLVRAGGPGDLPAKGICSFPRCLL